MMIMTKTTLSISSDLLEVNRQTGLHHVSIECCLDIFYNLKKFASLLTIFDTLYAESHSF